MRLKDIVGFTAVTVSLDIQLQPPVYGNNGQYFSCFSQIS